MSHTSPVRSSDDATVPRWALPALAVLLVQVALYLWMAPRGFDFSDEPYYFHNYLHWREFTGTVTFFGAYFEWPFRAMGMSIAGARVLSLLLVLASSAVLMDQVLRFSAREQSGTGNTGGSAVNGARWCYLIGPMAAAMLYFGYLSTLRAPSYNLLTLGAMTVATACLLRTLEQQAAGRSSRGAPLLYGIALGTCFLSKATTSLLLVLVHSLFFSVVNRSWAWKRLLEIFVLILTGFAVNFIVLTVEFPAWRESLREGIQLTNLRGGYGMIAMFRDLSWETQHTLLAAAPWLLLLAVVIVFFRRKLGAASPGVCSLLTVALVSVNAVTIASVYRSKLWLFVMAATAMTLWSLELLARRERANSRGDRAELALMVVLLLLPLAFSFGTNLSVLSHSAIASLFAYCAVYLRLYRLAHLGMLTRSALAACVCLLCVPSMVVEVKALTDARYTYRHLSPLSEQDLPIALGAHAAVVRVDRRTRTSLNDLMAMAKTVGFRAGESVLDFSGDGPGVIYVIGAKPLGTPWLIGGHPNSALSAGRVIEKLNEQSIRRAWLLTSSNNPRRILGWEAVLACRIGSGSHKLVAEFSIANPYSWGPGEPGTIKLQFWKPATPAVKGK